MIHETKHRSHPTSYELCNQLHTALCRENTKQAHTLAKELLTLCIKWHSDHGETIVFVPPRWLIEAVNKKYSRGNTLLHTAGQIGSSMSNIFDILLICGANPEITNDQNQNVYDVTEDGQLQIKLYFYDEPTTVEDMMINIKRYFIDNIAPVIHQTRRESLVQPAERPSGQKSCCSCAVM